MKQEFDLKDPLNAYMTIVILIILASSYYFWSSVYSAFETEIQQLEVEKGTKQAQLDDVKKQVSMLTNFTEQLAKSDVQLEELKLMFPDEESVPYRLQDLYKAIRKSGVKINRFEPSSVGSAAAPVAVAAPAAPEAASDDSRQYYQENYYQISLEGGYHMFGQIFAELANFPYPTKITDLKVSPFPGLLDQIKKAEIHGIVPVTMSIEFKLTTYSSRK
jgi:type IV pilus assembly protein PilO